jgi:hypothetical protein
MSRRDRLPLPSEASGTLSPTPETDQLDTDTLIVKMLHELHSHLPEDQRPMAMCDLSDEQAERARKAVNAVVVAACLSKPAGHHASIAELEAAVSTPETGLVEALMEYGTHKSGCRMRVAMGQSCICGWAEVSAKVKAAASESPLLSERPLRAGADHAPGSASRDGSEATTPPSNVLPDEV